MISTLDLFGHDKDLGLGSVDTNEFQFPLADSSPRAWQGKRRKLAFVVSIFDDPGASISQRPFRKHCSRLTIQVFTLKVYRLMKTRDQFQVCGSSLYQMSFIQSFLLSLMLTEKLPSTQQRAMSITAIFYVSGTYSIYSHAFSIRVF